MQRNAVPFLPTPPRRSSASASTQQRHHPVDVTYPTITTTVPTSTTVLDRCVIELPVGLPEEQKRWYCQFQKLFKGTAADQVEFLKSCDCFDEKTWSENLKHALHKELLVGEQQVVQWTSKTHDRQGSLAAPTTQQQRVQQQTMQQQTTVRSTTESCEMYKQAMRQVQSVCDRGTRSLAFRMVPLTRIPTNIVKCRHLLTKLVLQDLPLHQLPRDLSLLSRLETLQISKCPLYDLPDSLGLLRELSKLSVTRCRLRSFPLSVASSCQLLKHLDLKYNFLSDRSDGPSAFPVRLLSSLPLLQTLDVEGNPLTLSALATSFDSNQTENSSFPALATLNINQTDVVSLPDRLASKLLSLSWTGVNGIQKMPSVGKHLRYLNLAGSSFLVPLTGQEVERLISLPNLEYANFPYGEQLSETQRRQVKKKGATVVTCKATSSTSGGGCRVGAVR